MPDTRVQERPHGVRGLGFTLVEVVVVLVIVSVLISMAAAMSRGSMDALNRRLTTQSLDTATAALAQFVTLAHRLPCPADGALPSGDPAAGRERRTAGACDLNQARGVVPWVTLGLREDDVVDGYGGRLTFRAGADLVADEALLMAACDAAGQMGAIPGAPGRCSVACVDGTSAVPTQCTRIKDAVTGRGLRVMRADGVTAVANPAADPPTGAAYVLMSHGVNRGGSYGRSGVVQAETSTLAAGEMNNAASSALVPYYVDDEALDDRLVHPSILSLTQQAGTGPRPHRPAL